jgi:hypothetical protein
MVDPRWTSAQLATVPAVSPPAKSVLHAEDSATSPPADPPVNPAFADCELCHGTGVMTWMQMCPDGVLRNATHPCIRDGHAVGWYRSVEAEDRVIVAVED